MATSPIPGPAPITLTVLDPLSADITVVCNTITAVCNLYCTPAGQKLLTDQMALGHTLESAAQHAFATIWNGIVGLFKKL